MYYGYTDCVPGVWHIAVGNKSARNKFKLDFPIIKPHYIEASRLNIGVSEGNIDGITVKIYDRERVVCDCLRHVNTMDVEVFNTVIQKYISDKEKDVAKLMMYALKLGVEKKARRVVDIDINLMAHIKNVRIPFSVDIGVDDEIVPVAVKRTVPTRQEGFKEPNIYTYSLESIMAEKLDAILKRMTASSRMKDFYDIYYWSQVFDFEGRVLQEAIFESMNGGLPVVVSTSFLLLSIHFHSENEKLRD